MMSKSHDIETKATNLVSFEGNFIINFVIFFSYSIIVIRFSDKLNEPRRGKKHNELHYETFVNIT